MSSEHHIRVSKIGELSICAFPVQGGTADSNKIKIRILKGSPFLELIIIQEDENTGKDT